MNNVKNHNDFAALPPGYKLKGNKYVYDIGNVLGNGAFGVTYRASVRMEGELGGIDVPVAVKEFFMHEINGRDGYTVTSGTRDGLFQEYMKKFVREAKNLSKLKHPNIIKVLESFRGNGTIYYAMEFVDGGDLDKLILRRGKLPVEECLRLATQIGEALGYMHANGMLHLDLKPNNIMMKGDTPVLIDFGLSKQYDEDGTPDSSTSVGAGTIGYAPIEQSTYRDGKDFPVTMDIYAFGATMFKMLTGHRPPASSDILNDGFPIDDLNKVNCTPALSQLIRQCMHPLKKERIQTMDEVLNSLRQLSKTQEASKEDEETEIVADVVAEVVEYPELPQTHTTASTTAITIDGTFRMWRDRNWFTNIVILVYMVGSWVTLMEFVHYAFRYAMKCHVLPFFYHANFAFLGVLNMLAAYLLLRNRKKLWSVGLPFLCIITLLLCIIFNASVWLEGYYTSGDAPMSFLTIVGVPVALVSLVFMKNGRTAFGMLGKAEPPKSRTTIADTLHSRHWLTNAVIWLVAVGYAILCFFAVAIFVEPGLEQNDVHYWGSTCCYSLALSVCALYSVYLLLRNNGLGLIIPLLCLVIVIGHVYAYSDGWLEEDFDNFEFGLGFIPSVMQFLALLIRKNGRSALSLLDWS